MNLNKTFRSFAIPKEIILVIWSFFMNFFKESYDGHSMAHTEVLFMTDKYQITRKFNKSAGWHRDGTTNHIFPIKYNLLDDSCQNLIQFYCLLSKLQTIEANKFWFCY